MDKPHSENKKLIPLYLQRLFWKKTDATHYIRMPEIFAFLETKGVYADRRTIYSAIHILQDTGFEIVGVQEKGGYKYHYPRRTFDNSELKFLIDAVAACKFLTAKKSTELMNKMRSLGSEYDRRDLNRNMLIADRIKSMNDKVFKNLDDIYAAIEKERKITFQYMKWTPERKLIYVRKGQLYVVSAFAVTLSDNNYYLVAFDDKYKNIRHYRIDKMKDIQISKENREGEKHFKQFNISDYVRKTFGMFSGEEENVTFEVPDRLIGVFIDRFGDFARIRRDVDRLEISFVKVSVHISPQFFGWVFGLGKAVKIVSPEIVSPESVINKFQEMINGIQGKYTPT